MAFIGMIFIKQPLFKMLYKLFFAKFQPTNKEGFMKTFAKILQPAFVILFLSVLILRAEIEPNNSYQQASTIVVNSSDGGSLNEQTQSLAADNDDYWQVTLPSDGSLYCSTNQSANLDIDMYIYDVDGNTILASGGKYGSFESVYRVDLKAGTYFIRAYRSSGTGTYTIQTKFNAAPYANDSEPNNSYDTAQELGINSSSTGHIKYYSANSTDYDDYWKVTIPYDGSLTINTTSDSADIDIYIYDIDGNTIIRSAGTYGLTETIQFNNLMPGTYYIRLYSTGQGGYTITSIYTQISINGITTNDPETNDEYSTAASLATFNAAGSVTNYGHIGYYTNNHIDYDDYWTVTTTTDGKLVINITSTPDLDIDLYLYDIDGNTIIKSAAVYGTTEKLTFENLAAGKFYVRVYRSGYGAYIINAEFTTPSMPTDVEPNNDFSTATTIYADTRMTGHLGYFANNTTDYDDYYVFTTTSDWDSLYVRVDSDPTIDVDMYLYDNSGAIISSAGIYGTKEVLKRNPLTAGTYYIRVYRSGYGSYGIKFSNNDITDPLTDVKKDEIENIPTSFSMSQNYPNPFNPSTTIKYDIPQTVNVTLKVYDVLGNEVATLVNEDQAPGSYSVKFNAGNLSSGIYFYRIEAGKFSQVKKFILMK